MKEFWGHLKFAWRYAKYQKSKLFKCIFFNILGIGVSLVVPILGAKKIIALTDNAFKQLILMSVLIFVVENIRNIVHYFIRYYAQYVYRETFVKLQVELGREILKLENKSIDANGSGVFIQRLTNDTSRIADFFNTFFGYLTSIITDIGIFISVFIINKVAFVFFIIEVSVIYLLEKRRVNLYNEKDKVYRKENEKVSSFVGEIVRGIRDIKMLNAEDGFMNELSDKVVNVNQMRYKMDFVDRKYNLLRGFLRDFFDLVLVILLVYLIINNYLEVASAIIIVNYSSRVVSIVNYFGMLLDRIKDFNLSATRIFDIINSNEFSKESFGNKHLNRVEGNFEFQNVSFQYNDEESVLNNLSFKVNANETVAFVGKSGAGKSTIFSLLCKMYDATDGKILIDGVDITELDKDTIRGNITIINQNPYIFNVSIRDNFRLVKPDMTDEDMYEACRIACLDEFIDTLENKYDTIIGEGGVNLSGGQKQRLAIARALLQKTEIILFDEATSALDNETQSSIQKAISNMQGEYTILIIAHRLSTIVNSDRILFLNDGNIIAEGSHQELLENCLEYRNLYEAERNENNNN